FQAEDGIRDFHVTGVQTCALPILKGTKREITTDITLGIASPEEMALKAKRLQDEGAVMLKVKLGKEPKTDIARIREIRKAVGFEIGRASCRERGYEWVVGGGGRER